MIESVVNFAFYGYFGGTIGDMLLAWQEAGFFSYLLPFLLIFALIFGILSRMHIFKENKFINGIIAFAVGLMALQFSFVPQFFSEIFPRLGVGLAILLVLLIFAGMFIDPDSNGMMYTLLGIGGVIIIIILVQTAGAVGWSSGYWWSQNWPVVAGAVFILIIIGIIVGASSDKPSEKSKSILAQALRGS